MTDTLPRRRGRAEPPEGVYRVRREHNVRALEAALSDDRPYAAYALGHLERGMFEYSEFWFAEGPAGSGLVLHSIAAGNTTVTVGAPAAVETILSLHAGPRASYLSTAAPEHLTALGRAYHVHDTLRMMRMSVTAATFAPLEGGVRRLSGRDANRINRLYATEGGPSHYSRDTIERAVYYGAFDDARLIAVAGTHIVAPNEAIGIVGNVFTDVGCRGLGLAKRVTSAVTRDLLERGCAEVVLTVNPDNTPAVRAYQRLGYRSGSPVIEARLRRRDLLGIAPALRRSVARRRSREPNIELVIAHDLPGEDPT
ncbi:MAG: GNAT family N-acetyltransferase [Chloroflexi bacterium]|nr:GNAT family N-acetyltransferase [Chloroflexota bacterium]MDA1003732.1 GNAT family N-acetyltransferase [Chloroflexota bacterium]